MVCGSTDGVPVAKKKLEEPPCKPPENKGEACGQKKKKTTETVTGNLEFQARARGQMLSVEICFLGLHV